ncbi:Hypothetical protein CAP_3867 [Chondromyces apiculatus DSM 436]|uniref:Insecticidal toxin complex protein n=1 Tax=Chondromyces apiculatus DSM 436 TaxID=1192034 RepID=A0A017T8A9_9BACT|nr:Hypothetical protein CAP_3867 [Chondromyces apiculatus DSM 436]
MYDSGSGNGPFGLGWQLAVPAITRKTDKGVPQYDDAGESDIFLLSGFEELVPGLNTSGTLDETLREGYDVRRYRPRLEGAYARIERWRSRSSGEVHWRVTTRDNVTHTYGASSEAQIADPGGPSGPGLPRRTHSWLLERSQDDRGNVILYRYVEEDLASVPPTLYEDARRRGLAPFTNRYLKRVLYGNTVPGDTSGEDCMLEVVLDYGEHDPAHPTPDSAPGRPWHARLDPFSQYRAGFEVRTHRLCQRVLMFHWFEELGPEATTGLDPVRVPARSVVPTLVRSVDLAYDENPSLSRLLSATHKGYLRPAGSTGAYTVKAFPPVEFGYTKAAAPGQMKQLDPDTAEILSSRMVEGHQWVDLEGEGLPGVLSEQSGALVYQRNEGGGHFAPPRRLRDRPVIAAGVSPQILDLGGDGQRNLVQFAPPVAGYHARTEDDGWGPFVPFASQPNIDWNDPNLRFIDLNGDGLDDLLLVGATSYTWYPSLGKRGFGPARFFPRGRDDARGPTAVFADPRHTVFLADMSGDGLTDLVRIDNGSVSYWPNLGHGKFGAKVVMTNAPRFASSTQFDARRIRLGDIDGSGTTDVIYVGGEGGVRVWFNQAGNGWSEEQPLGVYPDANARVDLVDVLGSGTACLVWHSPRSRAVHYLDLCGGQKPHLLERMVNNLGLERRMAYAPSTQFYLADRKAGKPWVTRLPFPVHVVTRVESYDHLSRVRFVSEYRYHHGYFDGKEREFRGFGLVEQVDTEAFSAARGKGLFPEVTPVNGELPQPPVLTKTWLHTGAWRGHAAISRQYEKEYFSGDARPGLGKAGAGIDEAGTGLEGSAEEPRLPDTILPEELTVDEMGQACRALRGWTLRQEVYALDGSPEAAIPYSVVESSHAVRMEQPARGKTPGVFLVSQREAISLYYERHLDAQDRLDPRVTHAFTLQVDAYGVATKSVAVAYPRRHGTSAVAAQNALHVTLTEVEVVHLAGAAEGYRLGIPTATRTYELHGLTAPARVYAFEEMAAAVAEASGKAARPYEDWPPAAGAPLPTAPERRLLEDVRVRYQDSTNLPAPLAMGQADLRALPHESYQLALTQGQLDTTFNDAQTRVTSAILLEGGYMQLPGESGWWIPSGRQRFDAGRFFLPTSVVDPWGATSTVAYDPYHLLVERTEDALGNAVSVTNDYRVMSPVAITDPNGNRSAVRLDALGMVVATAVMGKAGGQEGDTLDDPTTTLESDLFRFMNAGKPSVIHARARETHGDPVTRWQESYAYSDGSGRELMRKVQAEPILTLVLDEDGQPVLAPDGTPELAANPRWVGTGRTIVDNKGNPIKQYEPYFSSTSEYEDDEALVHWGVTPVLRYDPLGRLVRTDFPDGTCARVEFTPWSQTSWDASDTVLDEDNLWFAARQPGASPAPSLADQRAAALAAAHAGTPSVVHVDPLGRAVVSVADLGGDTRLLTTTTLDLEGNPRVITDARGNDCMVHTFAVAGRKIHQDSIDGGIRWMLPDVLGNPLRGWDSRGHTLRTKYDVLRRPIELWVQQGTNPEVLAERTVHGESVPNAASLNLRGKIYQQYDGAGLVTSTGFDFKGNPLGSTRTLAVDYQNQLDWAATPAPALQTETFTSSTAYDALNRPISTTKPDQSETRPTYNEAGLLEAVDVRLRGASTWTSFVVAINYNAKGQRERIAYGNGVVTEYTYDPLTFRLTRLKSMRIADSAILQDLRYTYDPVGNIVLIEDKAQQSLYHNGQLVEPVSRYEYDALYRLTRAEGREHAGHNADVQQDAEGFPLVQAPHPNDPQALRAYAESYEYDEVGNILTMAHQAVGGGWTRHYEIDEDRNWLLSTSLPGDLPSAPYSAHYMYDAHGNVTSMPHLASIVWDFKDQQREVDLGGGGTAYYVYDAAGQRVRKIWEHSGLKEERIYADEYEVYRRREGLNADLVLERETLHLMDDARRIAMVETKTVDAFTPVSSPRSGVRYQLENHLGSAGMELDGAGLVISYEEYHPYGTTAYWASPGGVEVSLKRYRYTRKERDEGTGLYYHGARYYACWLGRWTSADPAGVEYGPNLYEYVRGNPVRLHDPSGMAPEDDVPDYGLAFMQRLVVMQAVELGITPPTAEAQKAQQVAQRKVRAQEAPSRTTAPVGLHALRQMAPSTQNSVFVQGMHMTGAIHGTTAVGFGGAVVGAVGAGAAATLAPAAGAAATVEGMGGVAAISAGVARVSAGIARAKATVAQAGATAAAVAAKYQQQIGQFLDDALEGAQQGLNPAEAVAGAGAGKILEGTLKGRVGRVLNEVEDSLSLMVGRGSGGASRATAKGQALTTGEVAGAATEVLPRSGPIGHSIGAMSRAEQLARKLKLNVNSPTSRQVLNSLDDTVANFVGQFRKGSIKEVLPSEVMNMTVEEALTYNSTVRKLLVDGRFVK